MSERPTNAWHNVYGITPHEMKDAEEESLRRYGDIIDCPRPLSNDRKKNPINSRAAQFAPFAALVGFGDEIDIESRYVEKRAELSKLEKEEMNAALQSIEDVIRLMPEVEYTVFEEDPQKAGGFYRKHIARVRRIDAQGECLILMDRTKVSFADIREIRLAETEQNEGTKQ